MIRSERLVRRVGDRAIVDGVDVTIEAGESVSLVGPSGSGKTTLLSILGLLDRPDEGTVHVDGRDAWTLDERARANLRLERIGFVFQAHNLFEGMTLRENVALPAWRRSGDRRGAERRADALLERLGLEKVARTRASAVSGGEAQRAAIARAIVNDPAIVLADEPTGNLDSSTAKLVVDALFEVSARGAALLVATHDPALAARASRHLRMFDGQLDRSTCM